MAHHPVVKWLVLFCTSVALIGGILAYDSVGALGVFLEIEHDISATQLGILYSAYGLPNLVLAPFSGAIVDRIGCYVSMVIFSLITSVGTVMVALGTYNNSLFGLMVAGRILTGAGMESLSLAVRKNTTYWFAEGENRSLALSFIVTFPWLGTIGAFLGLPLLADATSASVGLWLAAAMTCCGLVVFVVLLLLDRVGVIRAAGQPDRDTDAESASRWVRFSDVKSFPASYWLICLFNLFMTGSLWPFLALAPDFFHTKWHYSPKYSGVLGAGFCAVSIVGSPLFGELMDRLPVRLEFGVASGVLGAASFILLGYSHFSPILGACALGLVLAIVTPVVFPIMSLVIVPSTLATALGISKSIENLGYVVMPFAFGALYDATGSFLVGCALFAATSLWGAGCCLLIRLYYPPAAPTYEVIAASKDDTEKLEAGRRQLDSNDDDKLEAGRRQLDNNDDNDMQLDDDRRPLLG